MPRVVNQVVPIAGLFLSVAFAFFVLLLSASLLVPLEVRISFRYTRGAQELSLTIRSFGGLIYHKVLLPTWRYEIVDQVILLKALVKTIERSGAPMEETFEIADTLPGIQEKVTRMRKEWQRHRTLLRTVLKHLHIKQFSWATQLGMADAAVTGLGSGALWAIKGSLMTLLAHTAHIDTLPQLAVQPHFNGWGFATRLDCIVTLHLGDAMVVGILFGKSKL